MSIFSSPRSLSATLAGLALLAPLPAWGEAAIDLAPPAIDGTMHVSVEQELGGELIAPQIEAAEQPRRLPITAAGHLEYDEWRTSSQPAQAVRLYQKAQAQSQVAERQRELSLRTDRRSMVVRQCDGRIEYLAADGLLQREELDLVDTAGDSLALAGLLPRHSVELGGTWHPTMPAIACLVGLDSIGVCEVSAVLAEANQQFARCQVAGVVHGVTRGASTELEIDGVFLVDRQLGYITTCNLALREKREIGPATPGLDAVAKIRVKIGAAPDTSALTQKMIDHALAASGELPQTLEVRSERLAFTTQVDASWYATAELGQGMTLRRISPEGLVAHANLNRLDPRQLDPRTALAEFRTDVAKALGKEISGIAAEEQWTNQHGCRVMSITAVGKVNDTDVEWHAYQVSPPAELDHRPRLAVTFTVEKSELARLAGQDRLLVDQLELLPSGSQASRGSLQK